MGSNASSTASNSDYVRPVLRSGDLELDLQAPTLRIRHGGEWRVIDLPVTEHRLLTFLLQTAGHARSREDICRGVWPDARIELRTVDQYVRRLRRSLQRVNAEAMVQTVNRYGYRLMPQAAVTALSRSVPTVPASPPTASATQELT